MNIFEKKSILTCLRHIVRPLVSFCLNHGVKIQELTDTLKAEFVEMSAERLERGYKINTSRVSAMTGVHRKDVAALLNGTVPASKRLLDPIARVVGTWQIKKPFVNSSGKPKTLSHTVANSEFHQLVSSVSSDLNPGTVLFELLRVGAVQKTRNGVKLLASSYVPKGDIARGFSILADDLNDLIDTVSENVLAQRSPQQLHARTAFDNIRPKAIPAIEKWLLNQGHSFHRKVQKYLSSHDQDISPDPKFKGEGVQVNYTSFSLVKLPAKEKL